MKFVLLVLFAICLSAASARYQKKCGVSVQPCRLDENFDPINIQPCPQSPMCHGKVKLFINDDGCCCNVDDEMDGHEDLPYLNPDKPDDGEAITLGECSFNEDNEITGGFVNSCPESSQCPPNTHLVLEEFGDDFYTVGRCCCAESPGGLHFV